MTTLRAAASLMPHPSAATVRLALTESQAAKIGLAEHWQAAHKRRQRRAERQATAATRLQAAVSQLISFAEMQAEPLSLRKLSARINIPERTFRRIRDQKVNSLVWLPRLEAALLQLKA
jgi:hypothetical protein